jgi:hypothetical protein
MFGLTGGLPVGLPTTYPHACTAIPAIGVDQKPRKIKINVSVTATETTSDPRHPSRFEKKKNTRLAYPGGRVQNRAERGQRVAPNCSQFRRVCV